jgi:hypothetical protein
MAGYESSPTSGFRDGFLKKLEIGAADARAMDLHDYFTRSRRGIRKLNQIDLAVTGDEQGFHRLIRSFRAKDIDAN